MPLIKYSATAVAPEQKVQETPQTASKPTTVTPVEPGAEPVAAEPKAVYTGRKKAAEPMTKDDYWKAREERDIQNGKCIRLSGVLQALLSSPNFGQYCTGTTAEDYLSKVEASALRLAKFVTEKAE